MNKNNFSYWFPKVEACGIRVPRSQIFNVPEIVQRSFWMNDSGLPEAEFNKNIDDWLEKDVYPAFADFGLAFVKNAVFSNKFNFVDCITRKDNLKSHICDINYTALCFGANGLDELVLREIINYDKSKTPCIYNGMPLRSEFRVFFDFDEKNSLYAVNYWDYEYCKSAIERNATDRIIFNHERARLEQDFEAYKREVVSLVNEHMVNVDLEGKWSVDILRDEAGQYWLIDTALAENSAYWKGDKQV